MVLQINLPAYTGKIFRMWFLPAGYAHHSIYLPAAKVINARPLFYLAGECVKANGTCRSISAKPTGTQKEKDIRRLPEK